MQLHGTTALVTGGAVRVGREIVLGLSRAGARVIIHYGSSEEEAGNLVDEVRRNGGQARAIQADLSRHAEVERLVGEAESAFAGAGVDILINNASVFPEAQLDEVDEALWEQTLSINLKAPFFLTQLLGRAMKARGAGNIVNFGDLAGIQTWRGYAVHSVSKAALLHFTRVAARALAPEVRVNAIAPGTVLPPDDYPEDQVASLAARTPLKRNGSPADVVQAVLYLAAADFVTGETIVVDGGRLLT